MKIFKLKSYLWLVAYNLVIFTPQLVLAQPARLENPLRPEITSLSAFLNIILQVLITLAMPIIVFFIIYAGFLYVTARGNTAQVEQATKALTYAVIGGVIVIGAVVIGQIIGNLVNSFRPTT